MRPRRHTMLFQCRYDFVRRRIDVESASCIYRDVLGILSFNQFKDLKGRNGIAKESFADQKNANQIHVKSILKF